MPEPISEQELEACRELAEECGFLVKKFVFQLVDEIHRLRELHADALRQIKLVREKADRDIARCRDGFK